MSFENRYRFMKRLYPDSLVLFQKNKKLYAMHQDDMIWEYFHQNLKLLEKKKVSHIIIDNLEIMKQIKYNNNQYYRYKKLLFIQRILEKTIIR